MNTPEFMVAAIENGTVIDHIPCERLFEVVHLLHLDEVTSNKVIIGYNFDSQAMGKKGIIKVADRFFSDEELNQLSVVAPDVSLCIIKDYKVAEKKQVSLPDDLRGIIRCNNPKCITNNEPMPTRFTTLRASDTAKPTHVRCHYCEWEQALSEVKVL